MSDEQKYLMPFLIDMEIFYLQNYRIKTLMNKLDT